MIFGGLGFFGVIIVSGLVVIAILWLIVPNIVKRAPKKYQAKIETGLEVNRRTKEYQKQGYSQEESERRAKYDLIQEAWKNPPLRK